MKLENLNLVELNAQEREEIIGGGIMSHIIQFFKGLFGV
jgi:hypothetical protein